MSNNSDIVIVDDNPDNLMLLSRILSGAGHEVREAQSGNQAFEIIAAKSPDLIMLDVMMPEMDGYEVCTRLKAEDKWQSIPVIFISALNYAGDKVKGFEAGCVDFVTKPFEPAEVLARVSTQIQIHRLRNKLEERNKELQIVNQKLETAALTDALTQLANRRAFVEKAEQEILRHKRTRRPFSIVLADVDHFKKFNDTYGHACGDYVLKEVASVLRKNARQLDTIARWGGEEFIFLLPETNLDGAAVVAEKIRALLENTLYYFDNQTLRISMTFGASEYDPALSLDECIIEADQALLEGKANGRNQVVSKIDKSVLHHSV